MDDSVENFYLRLKFSWSVMKQFANNCPGFDVQFRPLFEKEGEEED
jgi:hypothetical protein